MERETILADSVSGRAAGAAGPGAGVRLDDRKSSIPFMYFRKV